LIKSDYNYVYIDLICENFNGIAFVNDSWHKPVIDLVACVSDNCFGNRSTISQLVGITITKCELSSGILDRVDLSD